VLRTVAELAQLIETPKRLSAIGKWNKINQKAESGAGIEISGVIEEGISFRAQCKPDLPEESVSLLLITETDARPRAFARIDWRGIPHPNSNKALVGDYWGRDAGRTHFHDPRLHLHLPLETLFNTPNVDLPIAEKIKPEPSNFRLLLAESATILAITNLTDIPDPPWPANLSFL